MDPTNNFFTNRARECISVHFRTDILMSFSLRVRVL